MKIGFIGAGKVGCTLGKYLSIHGAAVTGYYDRDTQAAEEAARFVSDEASVFAHPQEVIDTCDIIFLTVPDGLIAGVCGEISQFDIKEKFICHCSGSISSREALAAAAAAGAYTYSIHPLFAVSDRFTTYRELVDAFFTLEGDPARIDDMSAFLKKAGIRFQIIDPAAKTRYHLAAVYASNLICALIGQADQLLQECGFSEADALKAIGPLVMGNAAHALEAGPTAALTGPVERGDVLTLQKHLGVMAQEEDRQLYRLLSKKLLGLAREKHPDRDFGDMEEFLGSD